LISNVRFLAFSVVHFCGEEWNSEKHHVPSLFWSQISLHVCRDVADWPFGKGVLEQET